MKQQIFVLEITNRSLTRPFFESRAGPGATTGELNLALVVDGGANGGWRVQSPTPKPQKWAPPAMELYGTEISSHSPAKALERAVLVVTEMQLGNESTASASHLSLSVYESKAFFALRIEDFLVLFFSLIMVWICLYIVRCYAGEI